MQRLLTSNYWSFNVEPMKTFSINTKSLVLLNIVTILSIKNWPFMAQYGLASILLILIPTIFFFLPAALVSAELATGWPEEGGVFVWVKEALGERFGFLAVWLLWISNVVWYPTTLAFIVVVFSYIFNASLAENALYNFIMITLVFWGIMLLNMRGLSVSNRISSLGAWVGALLPATLVVLFGITWLILGGPTEIVFSWANLLPPTAGLNEWVYLTGILLGFAGIEMNAFHANNVENPQRDYPRAILISTCIIVLFSILGTLSISLVLPPEKINLAGAAIEAISFFLNAFQLKFLLPLFCVLIVLGGLGNVSAWIVGPNKGLISAAQNGKYLPKALCLSDKRGTPKRIMVFQAVLVTALASVFLVFSNFNIAFWILIALASQLYLITYVLMFASALILRYKRSDVRRAFTVPLGNLGLWLTCGAGILCCSFAIVIGFIPPEQLAVGSLFLYEFFLILSMVLLCSFPFVIGGKGEKVRMKEKSLGI